MQEIRNYFLKNSFQFKQPLSFNIEYISLVSDDRDETAVKDKVKKVSGRLAKKEDFSKAAKELNLEVKESGFFGQTDPIPGIGWSNQIIELVWGYDFGGSANIVEVYVRSLRKKLEERAEPRLIQTVRGAGYALREE